MEQLYHHFLQASEAAGTHLSADNLSASDSSSLSKSDSTLISGPQTFFLNSTVSN